MNARRLTAIALSAIALTGVTGCSHNAAASPVKAEAVVADVAQVTQVTDAPATCANTTHPVSTVETEAWNEIGRLERAGYSVCDVVWSFPVAALPNGAWGLTYPRVAADDPRPLVIINADPTTYTYPGQSFAEQVDTTVRHEFGHVVADTLGATDASLAASFGKTVDYATPTTNATQEAEADAVAQVLTPADQTRTIFYNRVVLADELVAARALLDAYLAR